MNAKLSVFYFCRSDHIFFYYIICMTVPLRLLYYLFPEKLALHCITANLPPQNIKFLQQCFFEGEEFKIHLEKLHLVHVF